VSFSYSLFSATDLHHGLVRAGKVMVYACSGTALQYCNPYIHENHTVFVTSKSLVEQFESNRTSDDNLKVGTATHRFTIIF
jgi:hypothetical protein